MKKIGLIFFTLIVCTSQTLANPNCFLAKEQGHILKSTGDCNTAWTPQSTFKVALSVMGFDSHLLQDASSPSWSLPKGEEPYISACNNDHVPRTWIRDSCLWYSRILTQKLGMKKFRNYVQKFTYGNQDLSGEKGKNNGLTQAWVTASLKISPEAQTEFLEKLVEGRLPASKLAQARTREIMFIQELTGGWKLYGKTGNGNQVDQQGNKTELQHGWFVGYMEKNRRTIVFANHIVDQQKQKTFASLRARNQVLTELFYLIESLDSPAAV